MANGINMDTSGFGFRSGAIYRNHGGPADDGWYYYIGSCATVGPFPTKPAARAAADAEIENLDRRAA